MLFRVPLAVLLLGHGVAHLVGFVVPWKIAILAEVPYGTTILAGRVDLGPNGIRALGVLWLLVALAFVVIAGAITFQAGWWYQALLITTGVSLVLCVLGWPDSRLGLIANVLALGLAILAVRSGVLLR